MADALDLGSSGNPRAGSSPVTCTIPSVFAEPEVFCSNTRFFLVFFVFGIRNSDYINGNIIFGDLSYEMWRYLLNHS